MLETKIYQILPEEAIAIRKAVFVQEQGFVNEFDDIDQTAYHIVLFVEQKAVGTCRVFWNAERNSYVLGRVAVSKEYRGNEYGVSLVKAAEKLVCELKGKQLSLAAQVQAKAFYNKLGYIALEPEFLEEGCPHVWMGKTLGV